MSINSFRQAMESAGCRWIITVISLLFAVGLLFGGQQCSRMQQQEQEQRQLGPTVVSIAGVPITEDAITKQAEPMSNPATSTPVDIAKAYGQAIDTAMTRAQLLAVAKQRNIKTDDDAILAAVQQQVDEQLPMIMKMQLQMQKKLPENATDQQFQAAVLKETGKSIDEVKKSRMAGFKEQIKDPAGREDLLAQLANDIVMGGIEKGLNVTDEELKHQNDSYVTKRIYLTADKHKGEDIQKTAEQILADIKSNKTTFEQAMDKYTEDVPAQNKPKHENTFIVDMKTMTVSPDFKPLLSLKAGEISGVLKVSPNGVAIYRMDHPQAAPPDPNFEKSKAEIRKNYLQTLAASQLQADLEKLKSSDQTKWEDNGYHLLYDWYKATSDATYAKKPVAEKRALNEDYLKKAASGNQSRATNILSGAAMSDIWSNATAEEKKGLADQYMKVMKQFLQGNDSYQSRLDMVDLAIQKKDGTLAYENLSQAASIIMGDFTPTGQQKFGDVAARLMKLSDQKLVSAEQQKQLQSRLDSWKKDKTGYDAQMAKDRQLQEQERKKTAAAEQKAREQALKNAGTAAKPAPGAGAIQGTPVPGATPPGAVQGTPIPTPKTTPPPASTGAKPATTGK